MSDALRDATGALDRVHRRQVLRAWWMIASLLVWLFLAGSFGLGPPGLAVMATVGATVMWAGRITPPGFVVAGGTEEFELTRGADADAIFRHRWRTSLGWLTIAGATTLAGHGFALATGDEWLNGLDAESLATTAGALALCAGGAYLGVTLICLHPRVPIGPLGCLPAVVLPMLLALPLLGPVFEPARRTLGVARPDPPEAWAAIGLVLTVLAGAVTHRTARRWWREAGRLEPKHGAAIDRAHARRARWLGGLDRNAAPRARRSAWIGHLRLGPPARPGSLAAVARAELEVSSAQAGLLFGSTLLAAVVASVASGSSGRVGLALGLGAVTLGAALLGVSTQSSIAGGPVSCEFAFTRGADRRAQLRGPWLLTALTTTLACAVGLGAVRLVGRIGLLGADAEWADHTTALLVVGAVVVLLSSAATLPEGFRDTRRSAALWSVARIVLGSLFGGGPIALLIWKPELAPVVLQLVERALASLAHRSLLVLLAALPVAWSIHLVALRRFRQLDVA